MRIRVVAFLLVGSTQSAIAQSDGALYAALRGDDTHPPELGVIDPDAGSVETVGALGDEIQDLAYDADEGRLYGITSTGGLDVINRATGAATRIGQLAEGTTGIEYDEARQQLFATNRTTLFAVESGDGGAGVPLQLFGMEPDEAGLRGLAYDPATGTMFLALEGVEQEIDINGISVLDVGSGVITFLGTYKGDGNAKLYNNVRAIAFDSGTDRLLAIDNTGLASESLLLVNRISGTATLLREIPTTRTIAGLAFAPVPTYTPTPTLTITPTASFTPTASETETATPSETPTATDTPTSTATPSLTATRTSTATSTAHPCPGDLDGSQSVTVDELVRAVRAALDGCVSTVEGATRPW